MDAIEHAFGTKEWVRAFVARGGRALSIRQPWAWLILHAGKDIENRDWHTWYRGPVLIHASKGCTRDEYAAGLDYAESVVGILALTGLHVPALADMPRGCLVGMANVADCTSFHTGSIWFEGKYGLVLRDVRPFAEPIPCKGSLGLFQPFAQDVEVRA